jgi:ribose/xylose/arabinose/galactoside ABC-type transport system permease subunit
MGGFDGMVGPLDVIAIGVFCGAENGLLIMIVKLNTIILIMKEYLRAVCSLLVVPKQQLDHAL